MIRYSFILNHPFPQMVCLSSYLFPLGVRLIDNYRLARHICALAFPDLSLAHDQVLDSFLEGHRNGNDPRHLASIQAHYGDGWGNTNVRAVQEGTVDYLEAQGAFGSNPPGSSSATIADTSSSLSDDGSYSQYGVQDDYPHITSSSRGQVEGASQSHAVTQGQDAARQETHRRRQQKIQAKKERDRIRKESDRAADDRAYSRVCTLLAIKLKPKNTRSQRSECLCIHRVRDIERFVVQEGVESIDQDFEKMCELLEISMTPRKTLAHRGECFCILFSSEVLNIS